MLTVKTSVRRQAGRFLWSALAQHCQLCAAPSGRQLLCCGCLSALPRLKTACPRCAMPMATAEVCGQCLKRPPHFDATRAAVRYAFPADQLVLGLKYAGRLPLAALFAGLLNGMLQPEQDLPDLLVAMPLHRTRLAERGFNQALEIARRLAAALERPVQVEGIRRVRDTAIQAGLPAAKRQANVRRAFECELDLSETSVAIVDDVMTTGASLNELARVLKRAGALRVENWVVARTWPEPRARMHIDV